MKRKYLYGDTSNNMPDIIHYAIPAFILLMIVESTVNAIQDTQLYEVKDTAASPAMGIGNVIIKLFIKVPGTSRQRC